MLNALLLTVATVAAADSPPSRLGIFNLAMVGVDPGLQQTAIDALSTTVAGFGGYTVVTRGELDALMGAEKLKDSLGCDDVSCLAELGMAAGVERVIAGSVSKVGDGLVVSLQLVNVRFANTENRTTLTWVGPASTLPDVLGAAAELLALPGNRRAPGSLRLSSLPAEAVVSVDATSRGAAVHSVEGLEVGVHTLVVSAPGFEDFRAHFVVRSNAPSRLDVALVRLPDQPFYATWWFWTAAGVLAAGGGAGIYFATRHSAEPAVAGSRTGVNINFDGDPAAALRAR